MTFARPSLTAFLLILFLGLNSVSIVSGWEALRFAGPLLFLLYSAHCAVTLRRQELPLLILAALTALALLLWLPDPWPVLWQGAGAGTSLGALIMALGLLQAPATRSQLVQRCGEFLIAQAPGRRYLALTLGGHFFGIVLNLGALPLLGAMIQKANTLEAAGGSAQVRAVRMKRMSLSLLRGFGAITLWAPSTITIAVCLSLFPSIEWVHYAVWGVALAAVNIAAGWIMDRLAYSRRTRFAVTTPISEHRITNTALPMIMIVCAMLFALMLIKELSGWSLIRSLILTVPSFSLLWLALQCRGCTIKQAVSRVLHRTWSHLVNRLPDSRYEVLILSLAGFIGVGVGALISPQEMSALAMRTGFAPYPLLVAIVLIIVIAGQAGISPVITVTLLGSAASRLNPTDMPVFALFLSLIGAWNLVSIGSPLSAIGMIVARLAGQSPQTVVYRWNGTYCLFSLLFLLMAVAIALVAY